jgi:hypothetical protein
VSLPPTKELIAESESAAGGLFRLWLRITRILDVQDKHAKLIEAQAAELTGLREAVLTLQAREDVLLARAELAAMKAATETMNDQARRIGHLEARTGRNARD